MRSSSSRFFVKSLSTLSLALPLLVGCGAPTVNPAVELVDRSTKALSLGSFLEVNGLFGTGCTSRTGSWSVGIGGFSALTNPPLTVIANDTGCGLSVTSVRVGSSLASNLFVPAAAIPLGAYFASSGSPFVQTSGSPVDFYGNLKIQPDISFATDFSISLIYSEDPNLVAASAIANSAVQSATAGAGAVDSPDYTLDVAGITMQVDANKVVHNVGGSAVLSAMNTMGQTFIVSNTDFGAAPTYAMLDTEFQAGTQLSLNGTNPMLAAADFALVGASLVAPQVRTMIVANTVAGTRSYEAFRIVFSAP